MKLQKEDGKNGLNYFLSWEIIEMGGGGGGGEKTSVVFKCAVRRSVDAEQCPESHQPVIEEKTPLDNPAEYDVQIRIF